MSNDTIIDGTATETPASAPEAEAVPVARKRQRGLVIGAIAVPLALGAAGLSLAQSGTGPSVTPVEPVAVSALTPSGATAARGEVAEIFGNKFVVQDGTGRALVETGRQGEGGKLVGRGETVTVQGRFEKGFLHARVITRADGTKIVLGPAGGPPPGTLGWAADKIGLGPKLDAQALTAVVEKAGYRDVRVTGRGPRHLEMAAKSTDGAEHMLHVGPDGSIREKPLL